MSEVFRQIDCPVCKGSSFKVVFETTPMEFLSDYRKSYYNLEAIGLDMDTSFHIQQCKSCSFVFVNPRLRGDLYDAVYNEAKVGQYSVNEWAFVEGDLKHLHNLFNKWGMAADLLGVVSYLKDRFSKAKNEGYKTIRLLDYGSGMGHLLDLCRVFEIDAVGVDIDEFRLDYCLKKGHRVLRPGELPASEKFDITVSRSVVEHVDDLNQYFAYVADRMLPGGIFSLNGLTPRIIDIERRKSSYRYVMLLEHLNFFTRRSLKKIVSKHGFRIISPARYVQAIQSPIHYTYPFLKNIVFRGFYPNGMFKVDLMRV